MDASKLFGVGDWVSFGHKEVDGQMVATSEGWVEKSLGEFVSLCGVREIGSSRGNYYEGKEVVSVYDCFPQGENEFFDDAEIECVELRIESKDGSQVEDVILAPRTPVFFEDFDGEVTVTSRRKKMLLSEFVLSPNTEIWVDE